VFRLSLKAGAKVQLFFNLTSKKKKILFLFFLLSKTKFLIAFADGKGKTFFQIYQNFF
jgi:hypothetical protein